MQILTRSIWRSASLLRRIERKKYASSSISPVVNVSICAIQPGKSVRLNASILLAHICDDGIDDTGGGSRLIVIRKIERANIASSA